MAEKKEAQKIVKRSESDIMKNKLINKFPAMKKIGCSKCNKSGYKLNFLLSSKRNAIVELCECSKSGCSCEGSSPYYSIVEKEGGKSSLEPCRIYPLHKKIERVTILFHQSELPWRYKYKFYLSHFEYKHIKDTKFIQKLDSIVAPIWEGEEKNLPEGIFLTGSAGTGKTLLATIIINELIFRHAVPCLFMKTTRSLDRLRATYNVGSASYGMGESIESYYHRVPVLVLDDFGAQKETSWADETLYDIIDTRYEEGLCTIVTSNLNLKELSESGAGRISSRLLEICHIIEFPEKNYRQIISDKRKKK